MNLTVNFGPTKTGLGNVGYTIKANGSSIGSRVTSNIFELGGGCYVGESISIPTNGGSILWDSGESSPLYACDQINTVTVGTNLDKTGYTASTVSDKTGYTVSTVSDKTGYTLASTGLDSISTSAPSGAPTTFTQMLVMLYRRFFKQATCTSSNLTTYADDGITTITSQSISDNGTTQTQGTA